MRNTTIDIKGHLAQLHFSLHIERGGRKLGKKYQRFYDEASAFLPDRIFDDYLCCFAYGLDASCYRYIPKLVIWAHSEEEICKILALSHKYNVALTFRAAGTSLSGQASSDSVLVVCNAHWKGISVRFSGEDATSIWCDCGVIGADANAALAPYRKKIGPDPATINNALIGGIFSNNSSGMCCGVKQNSYQTVQSVRAILFDGTILDTSDPQSLESFCQKYPQIVEQLLALRAEILADNDLTNFIKRKFAIKNTTGYSINALIDFETIKDILNHIFIGAEGTLGFISRVEYECIKDFAHKACALLFYHNLADASHAIQILAKNDAIVSAAEMMDYASLVSVQNMDGMPPEIKKISEGNCAILIQLEEDDKTILEKNIATIKRQLGKIRTCFGVEFSFDAAVQETWWKIRKGLLPIAASMRPSGSTVIVEDICFEIKDFASGIEDISQLFKQYNFDGIIFGHALSGNVHFIITPVLGDSKESKRFGAFMEALADVVVRYNGSVKAEHGTGRMVAPFVQKEWGEKAYLIHKKIKAIFDSRNLINPDVIISDNPKIHLKNLKPSAENLIEDYLDACMECGFCEKVCPSRNLTLTPRQRIAVYREIKRLESIPKDERSEEQEQELQELHEGYAYFGVETCATCSMCATLCPLAIDTAKIALKASQKHGKIAETSIGFFGNRIGTTTNLLRFGVGFTNDMNRVLSAETIRGISQKFHKWCKTPVVLDYFPRKNTYTLTSQKIAEENGQVVYFSSCLNRAFAPSAKSEDKRSIAEAFENLCKKAKFTIVYPDNIQNLCCSKAYKNHTEIVAKLVKESYDSLRKSSKDGAIPIVCDHSACSLELFKLLNEYALQNAQPKLQIIDMPAFIDSVLAPHLSFAPNHQKIALYAPCSTRNNALNKESTNWERALVSLAQRCGAEVVMDSSLKCCGFAGNKGFFVPELNASALENFGQDNGQNLFIGISKGFSSSSTCEIGLSHKSGFSWQHIVYLVDSCSAAL